MARQTHAIRAIAAEDNEGPSAATFAEHKASAPVLDPELGPAGGHRG
ncbi:MAG: hypothetical protein V9G19_16940 [Tetrasphaera sp.]